MDYAVDKREARLFERDGDFLRVELYDGFFSIGWSCSLPLAVALDRVEPVLLALEGQRGVIFDELEREHVELDVREAVRQIRAATRPWSFARLELPNVTLIWEQAEPAGQEPQPLTKERYELAAGGEFGFMAGVFDAHVCVRLVRETATPAVSQNAQQLIDQIADIAHDLGHGQLATMPAGSDE